MNHKVEELVVGLVRRQKRVRLWWTLTLAWTSGLILLLVLAVLKHRPLLGAPWDAIALTALAAVVVCSLVFRPRADANVRTVARLIEHRHPELNGRLLTALEHSPHETGEGAYFQDRLATEILSQHAANNWGDVISAGRLRWAQAAQWVALAALGLALLGLKSNLSKPAAPLASGVEVSPGDARVERGSALVVLARFQGDLPPAVDLVLDHGRGVERIPLLKSLADPVFGGSIPEVSSNLIYRIEYAGKRTRNFHVTVFEYPRLERADATLRFPQYTRQPAKFIENTRRITGVEGSRLDLDLRFNKPVVLARLVPIKQGQKPITFAVHSNQPSADLKQFALQHSGTYGLQLVDAEGLTNRINPQFVFEVLKDRPPELRLTMPRGDLRPSPLEEVAFQGTVWDDFGVSAYGVGYSRVGEETKFIELGHDVPGKETRPFHYLLRLEELGVQPDELISWFVWADDAGPDGRVRRTTGDLFFAEVRPFDEIFREGQGSDSQQGQSGQSGGRTARLAQLQKQIISATWNLSRAQTNRYEQAATTVRDSQAEALDQAQTASNRQQDPRGAALWPEVVSNMQQALNKLKEATHSTSSMAQALPSEQAAYQSLLRLQEHEFQVSRSRNRGQSGAGGQQMQRQLEQLDLTQDQDRYENQRLAQQQPTPQRLEQLHVLNRLQELARRQQDLNQRLQELQTALAEARTDQQRAELQRRLKRLQEDEQQMLADVDELRQRMDRPENQSEMSSERQQLDQTRQEVQRAADAAAQGGASQALAAGTRAEQQFEQLHDQMRKESSSQFADDLRGLRNDARELARDQQDLLQKLQTQDASAQKSLSDEPQRQAVLDQAGHERQLLTNLLARAVQVSEQAEQPEPLLSRQLYDTLRGFSQQTSKALDDAQNQLLQQRVMTRDIYNLLREKSQADSTKLMDLTSKLVQGGFIPQADDIGQRMQAGLDRLKSGVEQAAQSVLGDDTEALRLAQQQLGQLTDELQKENLAPQEGQTNASQGEAAASARNNSEASRSQQAGNQTNRSASGERRSGSNGGQNSGAQVAENRPDAASEGRNAANRPGGSNISGRGGAYGGYLDRLLEQRALPLAGPITGGDYVRWSERLADVQDMLDRPDLRNQVAIARERVRVLREDYRHDRKRPDWAVLNLEVMKPLLEVRQQISEELQRRDSKDALVPLDREPVPHRYAELVRRYYEELGK